MKKQHLFLVVSVVSLIGCVANPSKTISANDPQQVAQAVSIQRDEFKKTTTYEAPRINFTKGDALRGEASLRAIKAGEKLQVAIYVSNKYSATAWQYFSQAYDNDGTKLPTVVSDRIVDRCNRYVCYYTEEVGISLTLDYLKAHVQSGATFKVASKGVDVVFSFPGAYFEGFLRALNL